MAKNRNGPNRKYGKRIELRTEQNESNKIETAVYRFSPTYDHETSYTYSPWVKDVPYWFWGEKVKGQGHGAWLFENGFWTITDSVINQWSWNFIHLLTMSQGCALLILRSKVKDAPYWFWGQKVKGQGHGAWLFENGFRTITDSVINLWSWNFIHLLTMSQGCALLILRSKGQRSRSWRMVISPPPVKPEGTIGLHSVCLSVCLSVCPSVCPSHYFFENGFRTITDSVIHLWSWNFIHLLPMSQGCALLILGSKGQRSRSWRMVIWKWFPNDNWLCNQPMIMKLHTLTHH